MKRINAANQRFK